MLAIEVFDILGERYFPWLLPVIGKFPEFLGIETQLARHWVGLRQVLDYSLLYAPKYLFPRPILPFSTPKRALLEAGPSRS
jgi:hypothetical protein